jgi:hypothetical protein
VLTTLTAVKGTYMSKDLIQLILEDHNRGREMYRQYMAPTTNSKQKQLLAWHMIRESYVHSYKEEEVCARGGGYVSLQLDVAVCLQQQKQQHGMWILISQQQQQQQ